MPLRLRRGTNAERLGFTPSEGELIYVIDSKRIYVGDGTTIGGVDIVAAAGGALTADLDLNNNDILGTGTISINGNITATNFIGNVTGNVNGNTTGTHFGNVIGNVTGNIFGNLQGDFEGDLYGNVWANDSTLLVDAQNNILSNGDIVLSNNTITVVPNLTSGNGNPYGRIKIGGDSATGLTPYVTLQRFWNDISVSLEQNYVITSGLNTIKYENFGLRGTFTSPTSVQPGDGLYSLNSYGHDGLNYNLSSTIILQVDNQGTVVPGITPGKITLATLGSTGTHYLVFNSTGKLGVNNPTPTSELDVLGNAKISGTLTAGGVQGSFFADDSSLIIDGITGTVTSDTIIGGGIILSSASISTADSSDLSINQLTRFTSDVIIEGSIDVKELTSSSTGSPELIAALDLKLGAGNAVIITNAPFRLARFTTSERDALFAQNGDMIYNTTTDKFQGYENGAWVDLI
jgi:hypothetical protein